LVVVNVKRYILLRILSLVARGITVTPRLAVQSLNKFKIRISHQLRGDVMGLAKELLAAAEDVE
jgi:hypothetical protein